MATALVALSASQYSVAASTTAILSIYRSGASAGTASASYATYNGTATAGADYTATSGTVTWNNGDMAPKTVSVPVMSLAAGKQFGITLTGVTGQTKFGSPISATVAIIAPSTIPRNPTSVSSSGGSGTATASAQATALLNYLTGLASDSRHILAGQHTSYWDSNPTDNIAAIYSQTGTHPAILGTTLSFIGSQEDGVALSNQWIAQGGIPLVSLWPMNPSTGVLSDNNRNFTFSDIYTPGTALNGKWNTYLDGIAAKLKAINGPVLFRPFVELDGNWFWWGNQPTAQFIALWQYTYNRIVHTDGVTNALWMYNVNAYKGNYTQYYPGSAYVDIVSWDSYPPSATDVPLYNALVALGKPIMLAETGVISAHNNNVVPYAGSNADLLQVVKANFPKVVGVVIWCQNASLSQQQGVEAFMTDSAIISLADLPAAL